jgi:hypothetical protein
MTVFAVIWMIVSAIAAAVTYYLLDPFPTAGAEAARVVDDAFMTPTYRPCRFSVSVSRQSCC